MLCVSNPINLYGMDINGTVISLFEDGFSHEEIDFFVKSFGKRDRDGKFQPFCFAITYFLKSYI